MFGIDLAKRDIAKGHQAVVVEGYTDVMAMHLAGVTTAVASCGTAFGDEHLAMLRRLMMDDSFFRGELIYVFDGDAAGRAAALKAFDGEQNLAGQSFVAVAPDGMDPCDLRLKSGDGALRDLVARRTPLFEFAIRTALAEMDLDSAEGRVAALRRCLPMVSQIKDPTLRDEYARQLAGLGRLGRRRAGHRPGARRGQVHQRPGRAAVLRRPRRPAGRGRAGARPQPGGPPAVRTRVTRPCGRSARHSSRLAVPGAGGAGVRHADRRKLHPSRVRGRPSGHRGGRRYLEPVSPGRNGSTRCASRPPRRLTAGLISELGVEAIQVDEEKLPRYIARGAGASAGGVDGPADRRGEVEAAAHVADRAGRRVPRAVRRPGRDGGLPAQPAGAGQRRRSHDGRQRRQSAVRVR